MATPSSTTSNQTPVDFSSPETSATGTPTPNILWRVTRVHDVCRRCVLDAGRRFESALRAISRAQTLCVLAPHPLLCACAVGPAGTAVVSLCAVCTTVVQTRIGACEQRCVRDVNVALVEYLDACAGLLYANRTENRTHSHPRTPLYALRSRNPR